MGEKIALNSALAGEEVRDLGILPVGLSAFSPQEFTFLTVEFTLFRGLDLGPSVLPGIKHTPGCSSQSWFSVFLDSAQQLTSLCSREAVVEITSFGKPGWGP
jgi:hypothetical protein